MRKKLADAAGGEETWMRPDADVRANVLADISTLPKRRGMVFWPHWGMMAMGLSLLTAFFYIIYLHKNTTLLHQTLHEQQSQITIIRKELQEQKTIYTKKIVELQQEKTSALNEQQALQQQFEDLKKQQEAQQMAIDLIVEERVWTQTQSREQEAIKKASSQVNDPLADQEKASQVAMQERGESAKVRTLSPSPVLSSKIPVLLSSKAYGLPSSLLDPIDFVKPLRKKKAPLFEVGYTYGRMQVSTPTLHRFEKQLSIDDKIGDQINDLLAHAHELSLAYGINRKWWVRAGVRRASAKVKSASGIAFSYDKTNEYLNDQGNVANRFLLTTATGHAEVTSDIGVVFERDFIPDKGTLFRTTINDSYELDFLQIPVGIDYFHGSGRLQWLLQGGVQWTNVQFKNYVVSTFFEYEDGKALEARGITRGEASPSKQYMSAYGGIGLDYECLSNWHIRAGLMYTHDFINIDKTKFSNSAQRGTTFKLGLHYRF
ncbi:MAG: hypothetical protein AAFP19_11255 [Bacteroidota bacterium]